MKILRVFGFGLCILMLKFLVPEIFAGLESTLLVFFVTVQRILESDPSTLTAGIHVPVVQ